MQRGVKWEGQEASALRSESRFSGSNNFLACISNFDRGDTFHPCVFRSEHCWADATGLGPDLGLFGPCFI